MKIAIELNLKKPEQKYLHVSYEITLTQDEALSRGNALVLNFPVWTPGSYLVREHVSQVSLFAATTKAGQPLPFTKIHKSQWKIALQGEQTVRVS